MSNAFTTDITSEAIGANSEAESRCTEDSDVFHHLVSDENTGKLESGPTIRMTALDEVVLPRCSQCYESGLNYMKMSEFDLALKCFQKALFLAPGEPLLYAACAEAYAAMCDIRTGIAYYRKALSLPHEPSERERFKLRIVVMYDTLAITYMKNGSYDAAEDLFLSALDEIDGDMISRTQLPWVHLHRAYNCLHRKRPEQMYAELQYCGEECFPWPLLLEATESIERCDFPQARIALERCLKLSAESPDVVQLERYFDEAFDSFKNNTYSKVLQILTEHDSQVNTSQSEMTAMLAPLVEKLSICIATFPHDPDLYPLRATCYSAGRNYALAAQDLFECMNYSGGSNEEAVKQLAKTLVLIADELQQAEEYDKSIQYYTEALRWDRTLSVAIIGRGDCALALARHEAAWNDYKLALECEETHNEAQKRLAALHHIWGQLLFENRKWQEACDEYTKAIDMDPSIVQYHYSRSQARLMMKEPTLAIRDLISCRDIAGTELDEKLKRIIQNVCPPQAVLSQTLSQSKIFPRRLSQNRKPRFLSGVFKEVKEGPSVKDTGSRKQHALAEYPAPRTAATTQAPEEQPTPMNAENLLHHLRQTSADILEKEAREAAERANRESSITKDISREHISWCAVRGHFEKMHQIQKNWQLKSKSFHSMQIRSSPSLTRLRNFMSASSNTCANKALHTTSTTQPVTLLLSGSNPELCRKKKPRAKEKRLLLR